MASKTISRASLNAIAQEARKQLARTHYADYVEYVHRGRWQRAKHLELICSELEKVITGETKRLMIFMPPRHGKSMSVTATFPSYYLGKYPDNRVIEVSYGDDLAKVFGDANRAKIAEFGFDLFGIRLSDSQATKVAWNIEGHAGGMISVGVGGGITGKGADLLIIDDPIKNRAEAESETFRKNLLNEWQSSIYTRLHPNAAVIIILTRWHEADLAASLLKPAEGSPEAWKVISLPCVCDSESDLLGRKIGEPLWAEHGFGREWCETTKRAVGSYAWASLYQQHPSPLEGGLLKRSAFKYYTNKPQDITQMLQSWDCTFKEASNNDFVAGHVWGKKGANYYLLDRIHGRMGITDTMLGIETFIAKYPNARAKCIEEAANGAAVIELMSKKIAGFIPVRPNGGKVARAQAIIPYLESGNIYLPHPSIAPWINDLIEECTAFPNTAHDDDVDAMTQGILQLDLLFGNGGGMIYRNYTENPDAYLLHRNALINRITELDKRGLIIGLNIGVAIDNVSYGAAFVATAIADGGRGVFCLATHVCSCNSSPDETARELGAFIAKVAELAGRDADYVYISDKDEIIYRTARNMLSKTNVSIRTAIDMDEAASIDLTLALMDKSKLTISTEDASDLSEAFMFAQWQENRAKRNNTGAANAAVLRAFERSIEKHKRHLIA